VLDLVAVHPVFVAVVLATLITTIFVWWSRRRAAAEEAGGPQPRPQHYLFAHRLLPEVMLGSKTALEAFRISIEDGQADRALEALWGGAGKAVHAESGITTTIPGGPPTAKAIDNGVLVTMPPALGITEAIYVAIVEHDGTVRYFTLEKSVASPRLCEWMEDHAHVNFGDVEASDEGAFLAAVRARLEKRRDEPAAPEA
jgi:hypothetical protein